MSDCRGVSASILQGIYSCADVCVYQALTLNLWASGWRKLSAVWELSGWAVLMAAWGWWKASGMCVWAGNSCSLGVMTTCAPPSWFTDVHDFSSLLDLWQDRQDAENVLTTPHDRCFHVLPKWLLWKICVNETSPLSATCPVSLPHCGKRFGVPASAVGGGGVITADWISGVVWRRASVRIRFHGGFWSGPMFFSLGVRGYMRGGLALTSLVSKYQSSGNAPFRFYQQCFLK